MEFLTKWFKTKKIEIRISKFDDLLSKIEKLNSSKLKDIYSSDYSIYNVFTAYNDIIDFIHTLQFSINACKDNQTLTPQRLKYKRSEIPLYRWFSNKGEYLNVLETTEQFKKITKDFLFLYENTESKFEKSYQEDSFLHLGNTLIDELKLIMEVLDNV